MPHICILCNKEIKTGKAVQHPKGLIHIMCWEREKARIAQREIELAEKLELVAVLEAREDFYKFCQYMDPGYFTEKKWHLKLIARYLNEVAYGRIKKLLVSLAPRAGKSYTVSMFHAWLVGKFPEDSCMRNSYAAELAEKFSYDIRSMIQKPKYLKVWPDVRLKADRTAVNDWATEAARDSSYFCAGVGGSILGKGCRRVSTLDDPVKNIEAALSETTMNSVWNWYTSTHMSRLESGCAELHVATRWSKRDPIGRLIDGVEFEPVREHPLSPVALEGEGWEIAGMPEGDWVTRGGDMVAIVIPALIDGKSFCDEVHTTEEFLALKKMTEEFIWEAEYMQNPIEVKGLLFPIDELNRFSMDELAGKKPDGVIGVVDTADEGTDFLSAPVGSKFGDKVYVIDVVFTQEPVEVTWGLVGRLVLDTECRWMQVESNSGGKGYALKLREVLAGKSRCDVSFKTELSNKETRIFMGSGYVKRNFYFRNDYRPGSDYDKFMRQLTSYVRLGKNTHDDAADSITKLAEIMETIGPVGVSKPAPEGYYTEDELRDKGYKPYEIKEIMRKMPKPWEVARR